MKNLLNKFMISGCAMLALSCGSNMPYQDPDLSADERAADLVSRLTLEEKVSLMQYDSPPIDRLGINGYNWWSEALHGVGRAGLATVFPQCIGMAASWNDALVQDVFTAVSDEARAKNNEIIHIPRPAVGTRTGDLRRRPLPHGAHGRERGGRPARPQGREV